MRSRPARRIPPANQAVGKTLEPIVGPSRATPDLLPHLVGEPQALLADRRGHGRAVGDLVDQPPQRWAGKQPIDELVEQPAVEEVCDELLASVALERTAQAPLHGVAV